MKKTLSKYRSTIGVNSISLKGRAACHICIYIYRLEDATKVYMYIVRYIHIYQSGESRGWDAICLFYF